MEAKADNAKGAAAMTDHLSQLDAAAELFRAMMHPGGIEAEHKAYCKAALALDHAAIAAALRAKDAEIDSLRGITVAHDALRIEFNRNAEYLRRERLDNARLTHAIQSTIDRWMLRGFPVSEVERLRGFLTPATGADHD